MCDVKTMDQSRVDCMLSGGCALPLDCNFSVSAALGYSVPSWTHDMNVTRGTSVLTVAMSLEDETVDSFDASKQAAFRESIAAVLEVDASMIELTVRELAPRGMEGSGGGAGSG